jgi:hypothetical protein
MEGNRGGIIWGAIAAFVEVSKENHTKNQNSIPTGIGNPVPSVKEVGMSVRYCHCCSFNPLPLLFKALLHGQKACVFFSGNLNV